uniref:Putative glycosyl hydrolase family5 n=1 Tax=uncultured symbiotic protist of Neotermes koshunensis TaxID=403660 RepID=A4UWW3_9EUKA|nr:putative glycosyl hydrolase family5 [uncultured symbiotic protist of Neotermes koshunensis]
MLGLLLSPSLSEADPDLVRLHVDGNRIVMGKPGLASSKTAMLRGVSCSWHNWWPQFHSAATVRGLKSDFHANVVRTFIGVEKEGGFLTNQQKAYDCCYAVVDECIAQGIYVIINWASFVLTYQTQATQFFKTVATKYHSSSYVIYELLNEPEAATWAQIKPYSQALIQTIRAIDPSNLILVPTPRWDQEIGAAANDPITGDNNLAYTLHIYTGTHPASYRDDARAAKKKIPVWADENGAMNADGKGALDRTGWNTWIAFYEELQIPWLGYGTQDTSETCSIFKSTDSFNDLSDWGKLLKETIRKYQ